MTKRSVRIILAPSKTMDFSDSQLVPIASTRPRFQTTTAELVTQLRSMDSTELAKLLHISQTITTRVQRYYKAFKAAPEKPALWAYRGDVYRGMYADRLTTQDALWAREHLFITSGLYGLLRITDLIKPHRIEMSTKLIQGKATNLYALWQPQLRGSLGDSQAIWICNCASDEYSRAVLAAYSDCPVIMTPTFYNKKPNGQIQVIPIYSKMMRGVFSRWMIDNRVTIPKELQTFSGQGYSYNEQLSTASAPAFYNPEMKPLQFN